MAPPREEWKGELYCFNWEPAPRTARNTDTPAASEDVWTQPAIGPVARSAPHLLHRRSARRRRQNRRTAPSLNRQLLLRR